MLYIGRAGRPSRAQIQREKTTLYLGAICPVLLWHAGPPSGFTWFGAGEQFLFHVPTCLVPPITAVYVMAALVYTWHEARACSAGEAAMPCPARPELLHGARAPLGRSRACASRANSRAFALPTYRRTAQPRQDLYHARHVDHMGVRHAH